MTKAEAIRWMRAGVALLLKFPDRRGFPYVDTTGGFCRVCLAGAAAVASFEGRPYTKGHAGRVAFDIDRALNNTPTMMNNDDLCTDTGFKPIKPMTQKLANKGSEVAR